MSISKYQEFNMPDEEYRKPGAEFETGKAAMSAEYEAKPQPDGKKGGWLSKKYRRLMAYAGSVVVVGSLITSGAILSGAFSEKSLLNNHEIEISGDVDKVEVPFMSLKCMQDVIFDDIADNEWTAYLYDFTWMPTSEREFNAYSRDNIMLGSSESEAAFDAEFSAFIKNELVDKLSVNAADFNSYIRSRIKDEYAKNGQFEPFRQSSGLMLNGSEAGRLRIHTDSVDYVYNFTNIGLYIPVKEYQFASDDALNAFIATEEWLDEAIYFAEKRPDEWRVYLYSEPEIRFYGYAGDIPNIEKTEKDPNEEKNPNPDLQTGSARLTIYTTIYYDADANLVPAENILVFVPDLDDTSRSYINFADEALNKFLYELDYMLMGKEPQKVSFFENNKSEAVQRFMDNDIAILRDVTDWFDDRLVFACDDTEYNRKVLSASMAIDITNATSYNIGVDSFEKNGVTYYVAGVRITVNLE